MNQSSGSEKGKKSRGTSRNREMSGESAPRARVADTAGVDAPDVGPVEQGKGPALDDIGLGMGTHVQLDAMQLASFSDLIKSSVTEVMAAHLQMIGGGANVDGPRPAERDPSLDQNPLREEYRKNIEAHRNKRKTAFFAGMIATGVFFALVIAFILSLIFSDVLSEIIKAASTSGHWHVLVFLGVVLTLLAAIPLSLAMALMKMISDKDSTGSDGGDMKAPGIELAKAIIDLCKNVTAAISK